jgi:hypothetical protein
LNRIDISNIILVFNQSIMGCSSSKQKRVRYPGYGNISNDYVGKSSSYDNPSCADGGWGDSK